MKFHYRMFSRRVILSTAAVLAVTGATGAAAVLAPSDLGLSRLVPNVTAQLVSPETTNDVTQLPFDRIAQAPITTPPTTLTDAPAFNAPAATPAPVAQAPSAPTPVAQTPVAQAPAARTPSTRSTTARNPGAPAPVAQAPATRPPAVRDPASQAPVAHAPVGQPPIAQAPVTQTPIAAPQGRQIMTSSPGVLVRQQHVQPRAVYRPRIVYSYDEYCAD
jgi:hypothetical protein